MKKQKRGLLVDKKPSGYWDDFEVLKKFLLPKCEAIGRMLITSEVEKFQGITHALQKHGGLIEVGKKLGFNPTIQYQTLSGDIVKSTYEVVLDNFLFLNNIEFCYENKIIEDERFMYDFKVGDIYIEIWGYGGKYYNEKRKIKEKLYKDNNLTIISLEDELIH
jgi:hypothetical protein